MKPVWLTALNKCALPKGLRPGCSYLTSCQYRFFTSLLKRLVDLRQIFIVLGFLLLGVLVYVTARPDGALFLPEAVNLSLYFPEFLIRLTGPSPVFFHVLGMSLLTVAILAPDKKITVIICFGWAAVNGLFEFGQHAAVYTWISARLVTGFEDIWFFKQTLNYFHYGTFDPADLLAIVLAAAIAYLVVSSTTSLRGERS